MRCCSLLVPLLVVAIFFTKEVGAPAPGGKSSLHGPRNPNDNGQKSGRWAARHPNANAKSEKSDGRGTWASRHPTSRPKEDEKPSEQTSEKSVGGGRAAEHLNAKPAREIQSESFNCVPDEFIKQCNVSYEAASLPNEPFASFAFIRTHKTGSSAIAGITNRILDWRQKKKLIPADMVRLGYPGAFPGKLYGDSDPRHQFHGMNNYGVMNSKNMRRYLSRASQAVFFTLLRQPSSHVIATFNYFNQQDWAKHIQMIKRSPERIRPHYVNSMAYDLGWYEFVGNTTRFDQDPAKIKEFIKRLDDELGHVVILERMQQGLVLLRHKLHVSLPEMVSIPFPHYSPKKEVRPTDDQLEQMMQINAVDNLVYAHFRSLWEAEWLTATREIPELIQETRSLRCLNMMLRMGDVDKTIFQRDSREYTIRLAKQGAGEDFSVLTDFEEEMDEAEEVEDEWEETPSDNTPVWQMAD